MPRINLLFILILLLTACTPNTTPTPLPTVTSSPVMTETATIDTTPAGLDMAPTDSSDNGSELFIIPTTEDAKNHMSGETEIPESIKEVVTNYKAEMVKLIPEVAEVCVVPAADVKLVFREGKVGDLYKWTIVYEAGQYTCWSTVESTGQLGEYPSYFDNTGRIKGHADRVSWERLEGKMYWAGTVPVLITNKSYIVPDGLNGSQVNTPDNWSTLEVGNSIGEVVSLVDNPISPENMKLLTTGRYRWDSTTGSLKNADGHIALTLLNGKWVDTRTGAETSLEALKLVEVNGVGFDGKDIIVILTRELNGKNLMYNPIIDAWVHPLNVVESQQVIDRPDLPKAERGKWRDYEAVVLNNLPEMTWDDFHSGRLFYSELLALKPWLGNVRVPTLQYIRLSMGTNVWTLSEYPTSDHEENIFGYDVPPSVMRPILFENDGVRGLSAFRMNDPISGGQMIVYGQQYLYKGYTVVLHVFFGGLYADPNSMVTGNGQHTITQKSLSNPPWVITEPIVNIKNDGSDWCGPGGLGEGYADQSSVCALLGYDDLDLPRYVLPTTLQQMIAIFDTGVQLRTVATETYPVGDEIFKLQQLPMPHNSFFRHTLDAYLLSEDDPLLDDIYPNP